VLNYGLESGCTLNRFQSHEKLLSRFFATIKGDIEFDKGFRTFQIVINNFHFCLWFNKQQIDWN